MPTPIAVLAADNHLEPCAWARYPLLAGDSYYSFEQTANYARRYSVPLVLAGDVFNAPHPPAETVLRAVRALAGVTVFYVRGQHDMTDPPWLQLVPDAHHIHGRVVQPAATDVKFYGLDWQPADRLAAALAGVPAGTAVLVAHQVWAERMGSVCSPEGKLVDVPRVRMVVTGDLHKHDVTAVTAADGRGDVAVVSPGSGCMQATTEDPAKYVFLLHDDLSVVSLPLRTRACHYHTFRSHDTFGDDLARAAARAVPAADGPPELATPMAVVEYADTIPGAGPAVERAFAGRAHLFLSTIRRRAPAEAAPAPAPGAQGVEAALALRYQEADPAVYATALRLYRAVQRGDPDLKAEVAAVVAELLAAPAAAPFATE